MSPQKHHIFSILLMPNFPAIHSNVYSYVNIIQAISYKPPPHLFITALRWRDNGHDSVSNLQAHECLLKHLFRRRSKKTSKLRVTGLCAGNSPGAGEFPAQMASNAENVSVWWRHHGEVIISDRPTKPTEAVTATGATKILEPQEYLTISSRMRDVRPIIRSIFTPLPLGKPF